MKKVKLLDGSGDRDFRYLVLDRDRHGNDRYYFRRPGSPKVRLKSELGSAEFCAEYQLVFSGRVPPTSAVQQRLTKARAATGSLRWLIEKYISESEDYSKLDKRTKSVRRGVLDEISQEPFSDENPVTIGSLPFLQMTPLFVRKIRDRKTDRPEAGNTRVKALRQVFKFGVDENLCTDNPARNVDYIKTGSDGFHSWDASEVRQFEDVHPIGTKARLALAILLYTGARRADAVAFGKQHVRKAEHMSEDLRAIHDGRWLKYTQHKGRNKKPVTLEVPILPELEDVLSESPLGDLTWLVTIFRKGFTPAGFGNWFRDQCDKADLPECSAHGLRKAGATIAAERGATSHQLMAIYGWKTLKEAERYTRAADQKRLAGGAMRLLGKARR